MVNPDFHTGLDWSNAEILTSDEERSLARWYADTHEVDPTDELSLTGFIDFWARERPDVAKSYRRAIETTCGFDDALPGAAVGLLFLHQYVLTSNPNGVLYEVIASRVWGASRRQIIETMAFAFIHAGPHGMAIASQNCNEYMKAWTEDTPATATWPEGWEPRPDALLSGIDHFSEGFSDEDHEALRAWHLDYEGEVPAYVDFLVRRNPQAMKAFRYRFETALRGALPVQMVPLFMLQTAGLRGEQAVVRRAAHMARRLGIEQRFIDHTASLLHIYTGGVSMDAVVHGLRD